VAPNNATLTPGTYEGAQRHPFQSAGNPGISVSGDGRACNAHTGRFVVLEANYAVDGSVVSFAADYEQHCDGGIPALFGSVRFNFATSPSHFAAYAGDGQLGMVDAEVPTPPSVVLLDDTGFPLSGSTVTFAVTTGGGTLLEATQITNSAGIATVGGWILGPGEGTNNNTITATTPSLPGSEVTFTASAGPQSPPTMLDPIVTQVVTGGGHSCAVTAAGGVKCWGANSQSQLGGFSSPLLRTSPVDVPGLSAGVASLAAGKIHTCALSTSGAVSCWGGNSYGQVGDGTTSLGQGTVTAVSGLGTGVAAIASGPGALHTCALTTTGSVKCWGNNGHGQLGDGTTTLRSTPVSVLGMASGVVALSVGSDHTCALNVLGGVKCWGNNLDGQLGDGTNSETWTPVDVSGLTGGVTALGAGGNHTCALVSGGVKCWGLNSDGQLGDGTLSPRNTAADVPNLTSGVVRLASGVGHTCALTGFGGVKCWGRNDDAQLGDGTTVNRTTPVRVAGLRDRIGDVAAGASHTCAVTTTGGVKCLGWNNSGQLGDGTATPRSGAVGVAGLSDGIKSASGGLFHTCVVTGGGGVKCGGNNLDGQLGDGTTVSPRLNAVDTIGLRSGVSTTSAGGYHSCALTLDGGATCWGYNGFGGLGNGTYTPRSQPGWVNTLTFGVGQVASGLYHTCALGSWGGVMCWGNNANGQLGNGTTGYSPTVQYVSGLSSGVISIATGQFHTCAVTVAGGVKCWGSNVNGKLGDGTTTQRLTPVDVVGLSGVVSISAGAQHTCAATSAGAVKCWGSNTSGQLGDGTTTARSTPVQVSGLESGAKNVSAGVAHTCAVTSPGGLMCWGWNGDGELGDGSLTSRSVPVAVPGLANSVARVTTGSYHTCAVTIGGGLKCWGYNAYGALGDGTTTLRSSPVAIQLGQSIAFAPPAGLSKGVPTALVASSTSRLPLTFDTWTPSTCTVTGNRVTVLATGSAWCGIRVSQTGNDTFAAAPQQLRLIEILPTVSIGNTSVLEGSSGPAPAAFTVALSGPSIRTVTASFATTNVNATSPTDYSATSGTVTFAPGETSKMINVDVVGDTSPEPTGYFKVTLSALSGAGPGNLEAIMAIIDDDNPDPVLIGVSSVSGPEGYTGGSTLFFPVRLSRPAIAPVTVNYTTVAGTAAANADYTTTAGQLAFAVGEFEKFISVPVLGDAVSEPNETLTLALSSPSGAAFSPGADSAIGTILNDDLSTISVTDYSIVEGTTGTPSTLAFTVILSATSTSTVTVDYATSDGTATAGSDYTSTSGQLSFPPGYVSLVVQVPVTQDAVIEPNETVLLNLSNAVGATIFDNQGVGTIQADDGLLVSVGDKTTTEGNLGFTPVAFTVSLSAAPTSAVSVDWATGDGTATAPLDYTAASGTLTFAIGETSKTVSVQVVGDTGEETYETFFLRLSNPTGGASLGDAEGQGTITNTDGSTDRSRLMFHNFVTNRLYRWHMKDGGTLDTFNWVTPWSTDPGWTVGAVADFDRDGQLDYLWHNTNTGKLLVWYIEGDNLKGYLFPFTYDLEVGWSVATVFDANGDGASDIVYYDTRTPAQSATSGNVRVVLHDNGTMLGSYTLDQNLPVAGTVRVVNAVDADNDGDDELVLYNSATGQVAAWDVTGATVTGTINYADTQSTTQAFNLVSTKTDFNDDGFADFLWHNPTPTGVFSVWFMNGTTRLGVGQFQPFTATDPVWKVVGSANVW
jgi:alpha-tubulin suppressor-like RCC1 family protein